MLGERGLMAALSAAIVLCYGLALVVAAPSAFPDRRETGRIVPFLADKPLSEDGWYLLTVSWNIGNGRGVVYNGGRHTVGFQPLQTFLLAPVARVVTALGGNRWTFARAVLAIGVLQFLAGAWVIGRVATALSRETPNPVAIAALALFNIQLFRQFTNGLETGLYTILVGLCVLATLPRSSNPHDGFARPWFLGAIAGCAALARIDFLVVFGGYLAVAMALRVVRYRDALVSGGIAFAMTLPWLAWVHQVSGHWVPSSGLAQTAITTGPGYLVRAGLMILAIVQQASPWFHLDAARIALSSAVRPVVSTVAIAVATIALASLAIWIARAAIRRITRDARLAVAAWAVAFAVLFAIDIVSFSSAYFYPRYAAPFSAIALPVIIAGIGAPDERRRWARLALVWSTPAVFAIVAWLTLHNGAVGNVNAMTAGYVARAVPPQAQTGAFQSGVVGYFNPRVANLDGKVDHEALAARRAGHLDAFIDARGIEYLVDWNEILRFLPGEYLAREWATCPEPTPDPRIGCLARRQR